MGFEQQRNEIKDICRKLLEEKKVQIVLGFSKGEDTAFIVPFFIKLPEEADKFEWNDTCTPNLSKYLLDCKGKTAIVAKACDVRAIVMYISENQIERDKVYIIAVECPGMKTEGGLMQNACTECSVRIPPIYDVLVKWNGKPYIVNESSEKFNDESSPEEKLDRLMSEIKKCIACFSCRQACYACYCEACFVDRNVPDWLPTDIDNGKKLVFHLGRAMHLAGRCVECGACERVCPSGVHIKYLVKELTEFCADNYGFRAGADPEAIPAMVNFEQGDKETGFIGTDEDKCC